MPLKMRIGMGMMLLGFVYMWMHYLKTPHAHITTGHGNFCTQNLRQIAGAKQTWAMENHKTSNDVVTWQDVQPFLGRGRAGTLPVCPQGGIYTLGRIGEQPKCSLSGPPWGHSLE
jgi:hypothetical protein